MNKVTREELFRCTFDILVALGENEQGAKIAAESLIFSDSRGITTHGTYLLSPIVDRVKASQLSLPTNIKTIIDEAAIAIIDGGNGLGAIAGKAAVDLAVKRASQFGISLVLIRNTNNLGALAYYTEMIARDGMIALMACNAAPAMAPWGGAEAFLGTNPFAIAFFTGKDMLFSADMATSIVARGKIRKAAREGESIPDDWALDSEGNITTDPIEALEGALLPMGGPKGSAIALAIDILSGIVSGSEHAPNIRSFHTLEGITGVGASLIAMDIRKFMQLDTFAALIDEYFRKIKSLKKASFASDIYLPGEIEYTKEIESKEKGISLDEKTVSFINEMLDQFGLKKHLNLIK